MRVVRDFAGGVLLLEPEVHSDARGCFFESYNELEAVLLGICPTFVQDNHSCSQKNVLRGLHYQIQHPQGKLVRVISGEIFDVALDLRRSSKLFGKWNGVRLSAENRRMLWIPPGFAHGFLVKSDSAEVLYKATDYYAPHCERTIRWDDPDLRIEWPLRDVPVLSPKDSAGTPFRLAEVYGDMVPPPVSIPHLVRDAKF